jgi:hypothetical protein
MLGSVLIQSGEQLLGAFSAHPVTPNSSITLSANRIAAHGTAVHMCRSLPGRMFLAPPNKIGIFIAVSGNRFALPYIAAHHTFHAEPHLTGRIPLNQIILHNP